MSRRDLTGALRGLAAFSVSLAAASIGGVIVDGAAPPLQVMGDWVIRSTPIEVTEAIIGAVGHHDKLLLKAVMLLVAVLAASLVGIRFVRGRTREALVSIGLLGAAAGARRHQPAGHLRRRAPAGSPPLRSSAPSLRALALPLSPRGA